jgi:hypothetical protein
MANQDIKYYGRDFDSIKQGLIEFARAYYPDSYTDFNEASPGSLFIDLAAYVGDVLGYYTDANFKESMLLHAQERRNLLSIASALGYKPKLSVPAQVDLDVYQLIPASGSGDGSTPDIRYGLKIEPGLEARSTGTGITFTVQDAIDFRINNAFNPTEYSVYSIDNLTGNPIYYLAKKTVKAISAALQTQTFAITSRERFTKIFLPTSATTPIIGLESIVDSDGNTWYEVPYLAQDTIFERVENTAYNDPDAAVYSNETPYLLRLKKVPRRFITRVVEGGLEIQFGSGISNTPDEELLATPEQIAIATATGKADTDASLDPSNPLLTSTYGIAPSNTTLTVSYYTGGGVTANVPSNTITELTSINTSNSTLPTSTGTLNNTVIQSVIVNNTTAAAGGRNEETIEEIRQNALAQFSSQNRAVTREDYIMRCYSMPSIFGSVAKAFIAPDEQNNIGTSEVNDTVANPLALNLFVLGYNNAKQCSTVNRAVKTNLANYLDHYRMLTDSINIRDAYVINIGVKFDVLPSPNFNSNDVLARCIQRLKDHFNIDRWQINQPIIHSEIMMALLGVKGVQTVSNLAIQNLNSIADGYSDVLYDIPGATKNGITYPSLDPAIFEVKFPDRDIEGRITSF